MNNPISYILIRTRRKSVSIRVTREAEIFVRAPLRTPQAEIDHIVASNRAWIEKQQGIQSAHAGARASFVLRYGGTLMLRGKEAKILAGELRTEMETCKTKAIEEDDTGGVVSEETDTCFLIPPGLSSAQIKEACIMLYRHHARNIIRTRADAFAKQMGVTPTALRINSARTRWGSCSAKNSLNFSWHLVMADDALIDYVVVHELAHIKEHNHSARFWAIVAGVLPDYAQRKKELKSLQDRLSDEDWD